jgi:hypothetical protein
MKLNVALASTDVETARLPGLAKDYNIYFAPEVCVERATLVATGATAGTYTSSGGAAIPTGGRDIVARISSNYAVGVTGAMAITLDVTLDDDTTGTAVATFHIPTYTDAVNLNRFPLGVCADFVPAGAGNSTKKIKAITGLNAVANMTAGNKFEILTTPNSADFVFISLVNSFNAPFPQPKVVKIADNQKEAAFTRVGMMPAEDLTVKFKDRGALEQLNRFNGARGTFRADVIKDGVVLSAYYLFSGAYVVAKPEVGTGDDEVVSTSEGTYEKHLVGYARVS